MIVVHILWHMTASSCDIMRSRKLPVFLLEDLQLCLCYILRVEALNHNNKM